MGIIVIISLKEPVALILRQYRDYNLQRDRDVIVVKWSLRMFLLARIIVSSSRVISFSWSTPGFHFGARSISIPMRDVGDRIVHTSSVGP